MRGCEAMGCGISIQMVTYSATSSRSPDEMNTRIAEPQLPDRFDGVEHLEEVMTAPTAALTSELGRIAGDLLILGVGGKIGPTLARLARRAAPDKRALG